MDLVPWDETPECFLRETDFKRGNVVQLIVDAGRLDDLRHHEQLIKTADLIFIDAAKDGRLGRNILGNLETIGLQAGALVLFDDIRVWNMLKIWQEISRPKLDLTSFGHYSGTGLVAWSPPDEVATAT